MPKMLTANEAAVQLVSAITAEKMMTIAQKI
jgi:hypothetical protein